MMRNLKCVVVTSTAGSVMNELLKDPFFKSQIFAVVSDRQCDGLVKAAGHGVRTELFLEKEADEFCRRLLAFLEANQVDYVIAFYTKLFVGQLLQKYADRIVNLHPSLLPAFKGLHGFDESLQFRPRYLGTTIHFLDDRIDEGKIILQSVFPLDPAQSDEALRHRLFQQQCKSLLQVVKWLAEDRIHVEDGHVNVTGARFDDFEFSPRLEDTEPDR